MFLGANPAIHLYLFIFKGKIKRQGYGIKAKIDILVLNKKQPNKIHSL
jgi:hypothetical protein